MHQMFFVYAKLSSLSTRYPKEKEGFTHARTVFTSARLKIVPVINLYDIQCQCVDELSSSVGIKLQHPFHGNY